MQMTTSNYFNILNKLKLNLTIDENKHNVDLSTLMTVGARINPKRSFLFISKLLGKHLEVSPNVPKLAGYLLADLYTKHYHGTSIADMSKLVEALEGKPVDISEELNKKFTLPSPSLFIGFAETATGLGHGVSTAFTGGYFTHTTRENILNEKSIFDFEEEHSHATGHSCYLLDKKLITMVDRIVLIDDEITTGKTALNLMKEIHKHYGSKKFTVLSILDWRTKEWKDYADTFCKENGIEVDILALIGGEIEITEDYTFEDNTIIEKATSFSHIPFVMEDKLCSVGFGNGKLIGKTPNGDIAYDILTGRFGMPTHYDMLLEDDCKIIGNRISQGRRSDKTLVLGMGEFIYIPSRIASNMGSGISFKSSTRSPIFCSNEEGYPVKNRIQFHLNSIQYYLYNMKDSYEEVYIIHENPISPENKHELVEQLALCNVKYIHFYKY